MTERQVSFGRGVAEGTKEFFPRFGCRIPLSNNMQIKNLLLSTIRVIGGFIMKLKILFRIVLTAILVALNVVMERFLAYSVWNLTISFSFITVAFAAVFLGIPNAVYVAVLGDIIGALLFPFGTYYPGFTLTNALVAVTTGFFLTKSRNIFSIKFSVLINKICFTMIMNSAWIAMLYKGGIDAIWVVAATRIPSAVAMLFVEIIVLFLLFSDKSKFYKIMSNTLKKYI